MIILIERRLSTWFHTRVDFSLAYKTTIFCPSALHIHNTDEFMHSMLSMRAYDALSLRWTHDIIHSFWFMPDSSSVLELKHKHCEVIFAIHNVFLESNKDIKRDILGWYILRFIYNPIHSVASLYSIYSLRWSNDNPFCLKIFSL